ncbi:uncharacterized protein TNCV_4514441 [Trichonephila clavipes]|nr:uncharacterized protein TNCV_4514441 [Trichonephila clavipes]
MDVCKCIAPSRHGGTLNSRLATSPFVRMVEGEEMWEISDHPHVVLPQNWDGNGCMILKATADDWLHLALCHDEFRASRSGLFRSGGISNNSRLN